MDLAQRPNDSPVKVVWFTIQANDSESVVCSWRGLHRPKGKRLKNNPKSGEQSLPCVAAKQPKDTKRVGVLDRQLEAVKRARQGCR